MNIAPRYNFPPGAEITLLHRSVVITGQDENGYQVVGRDDGVATIVPYNRMVEQLKLPGAIIDTALPSTGGRLKQRLGGHATAHSLSDDQQENGKFHYALCEAVRLHCKFHRIKIGNPDFEPSDRYLDKYEVRISIANLATQMFGKKIRIGQQRGGSTKSAWSVYGGRTLNKYYKIYKGLAPGETPLDALVTLDHLKGNRNPRICQFLRQMMTDVWEEIGLDLKATKVATIRKQLEARIRLENLRRARLDLPVLPLPSWKTLREHRDALVTPTEYLIATGGIRHAKNKRGRGSTDERALLVGEATIVDECKISLIISAKEKGLWENLSDEEKDALEKLDEYIKARFWILVMLDVASRMPLAWVIAETPNADATLALFRMATRDKTREKLMYGCTGEPVAAVGLMHVKNDNGTGLRNSTAVGALVGIGSYNTITRTYSASDRAHGERIFGTFELDVLSLLPGFTGGSPGALPGYDAMANGVMTVEQLHEIVTRYFIDEYPSTRHHGTAMGGRRPYEVYKFINETRGVVGQIDPNTRRIQLGWKVQATPNDEGVRVFQGVWFNSDVLQEKREKHGVKGKVWVFVDPDDINHATVVLPNVQDPVEVQLQITAFADMTLPEVLRLMAEHRREDPITTEIHEDRIMRTRLDRYDQIKAIGVEHNLQRSYSTIAECKAMAKAVFAGSRVIRSLPMEGTKRPGEINDLQGSEGVYVMGGEDSLIDGFALGIEETEVPDAESEVSDELPSHDSTSSAPDDTRKAKKGPRTKKTVEVEQLIPRPKNLKVLK